MQRPVASVPKRTLTIGSLAQLGGISNPNTPSTGSTFTFTRPVASVPKPIVPGTINSPIATAHPIASVPKPVGVTQNYANTPISTPLGRATGGPSNYPRLVDE